MTAQRIFIPDECPQCGGPLCVTDLSPPTGLLHCHDRRADITCGWSHRFDLDKNATSYVFISGDPPDAQARTPSIDERLADHAALADPTQPRRRVDLPPPNNPADDTPQGG